MLAFILGCPKGIKKRKWSEVRTFPPLGKGSQLFYSKNVGSKRYSATELLCTGSNLFSLTSS